MDSKMMPVQVAIKYHAAIKYRPKKMMARVPYGFCIENLNAAEQMMPAEAAVK
jgi:hypothetical protein